MNPYFIRLSVLAKKFYFDDPWEKINPLVEPFSWGS